MTRTARGPYAKGVAKRAEILRAALDAYARSGREGPRLREIAAAVGLSEAGVLHYFESKDHLLVAILEARDEADAASFDLHSAGGLSALIEHTTRVPGLVKLFADMSAAAAAPGHPAHAFMARHTADALTLIRDVHGLDAGRARILLGAAEGLQLRWLREPDLDLLGSLDRLLEMLRADRDATPGRPLTGPAG